MASNMYVDNGPAIAFMIIMIIIIIFLVLALTIPTGNSCARRDCFYAGASHQGKQKQQDNKKNNNKINAAAAVRFGADGVLEASGLGQKFQEYETGKINGTKLGYNRELDVVQDSHGHEFPLIMTIPKQTFEIAKQGMKPTRNQIFVNRIDMNPGMCGGVPNDAYVSGMFNDADDTILISGSKHTHEKGQGVNIHLITDHEHAHNLLHKDMNEKVIIVASHGCGACRGLMHDLTQEAEKDPLVKQKLMSGHVHFIEAGTFNKANGHEKLGKVDGIPTIFHIKKGGHVHHKIVGRQAPRKVLGLGL